MATSNQLILAECFVILQIVQVNRNFDLKNDAT